MILLINNLFDENVILFNIINKSLIFIKAIIKNIYIVFNFVAPKKVKLSL